MKTTTVLEKENETLKTRVDGLEDRLKKAEEEFEIKLDERNRALIRYNVELLERMRELERLNRISVGRELRMIELKGELDQMQQGRESTEEIDIELGKQFPKEQISSGPLDRALAGLFQDVTMVSLDKAESRESEDSANLSSLESHRVVEEKERMEQRNEELLQTRAALLNSMEDMENKRLQLERKNKEVEEINDKLKSKQEELEGILYGISHDLKAPLFSIKGYIELLGRDVMEQISGEPRHYFERIECNANRLEQMIGDLLQLSRIGRLPGECKEVDMIALVKEVVEGFWPAIKEKNITVHIAERLSTVMGDRKRLYEVFSNLVGNAVKYSSDNGASRIEIGEEEKDRRPVFFVRDNGPGIPVKYHTKIFQIFQRGVQSSSSDGTSGSGIGLAMVKRIVERHNGRTWVESEPEKGSTFYFTLPNPDSQPPGLEASE